jgi:hypothetical protein
MVIGATDFVQLSLDAPYAAIERTGLASPAFLDFKAYHALRL